MVELPAARPGPTSLAVLVVADFEAGGVVGEVDVLAEGALEAALLVEHRDAVVAGLGEVDEPVPVDSDALRRVELAGVPAFLTGLADRGALLEAGLVVARDDVLAERAQERALRGEHRDAVEELGDVDAASRIDGDARGAAEQAGLLAAAVPELAQRHDRDRRGRARRRDRRTRARARAAPRVRAGLPRELGGRGVGR